MSSPGRRLRTLRASEIHATDAVRVVVIEAVRCDAEKSGRFYRLFARIEPTAMVVCQGGDNQVINLASEESSLEDLVRKVPGLRDLLAEA